MQLLGCNVKPGPKLLLHFAEIFWFNPPISASIYLDKQFQESNHNDFHFQVSQPLSSYSQEKHYQTSIII